MKINKIWTVSIVIALAGLYRLLPHISNITPVAAMALVGGMYLKRKYLCFLIPIATLYLSDLVLNNTINRVFFPDHTGLVLWSEYMGYVYGAFLLTVIVGMIMRNSKTSTKMIGGTLAASILFFLITNAGTWAFSPMNYPKNIGGFSTAMMAGVPFFRNTLLGNLIFIPLFVAFFDYVMNMKTDKKTNTELLLDQA